MDAAQVASLDFTVESIYTIRLVKEREGTVEGWL